MILAAVAVSAQPKISLRPQQTVMLYADSFDGNIDPVYGKQILYAGLDMKEATGLAGPETIRDGGMIKNVSDLARIDFYFPKKETVRWWSYVPEEAIKESHPTMKVSMWQNGSFQRE